MSDSIPDLTTWRRRALGLEDTVNQVIVGQGAAVRLLVLAVFARGHALLEGDVGVGKTTLLRAMAKAVGGAFARVEGTVDLMPNDLLYYAYLDAAGKPAVAPGPLLSHGAALSVLFFNEINRARPQVHALLLRAMAERQVTAFNREHPLPHLLVFADRNRVEREETFELPGAARDRFALEIQIPLPAADTLESLAFDTRFHDPDALLAPLVADEAFYAQLNAVAAAIQTAIDARKALKDYALDLCRATWHPERFGVAIDGVSGEALVAAGLSPRGLAMLVRIAKVAAWLDGRDHLLPEDLRDVFVAGVAHRLCFAPAFEMRRSRIAPRFAEAVLAQVAAP